ncbi:abortive infection family protein [Kurthia sibirica]|uniref:Abortive infection protein-like C-terminal domain-containing protein n=1 Tax=Kurthia sibirica TaxID=202750 RepID=A0A2U3AFQ0_9BACL|nr:abortive infection family protein [Kurthia sibirica]PWI23376.1 hypothetical protein DEX24_16220 [Kurthia sibirica]GEK35524.1 hypothetical protein KSI01_30570 [Kurthia sibirica]
MSSLSTKDLRWIEQILNMETGWVLNFNDRTFQNFVLSSVNIDIAGENYAYVGSKAKRLRHFFKIENDFVTQKLLTDLLFEWHDSKEIINDISEPELNLYEKCTAIIEILKKKNTTENLDEFSIVLNSDSIQLLTKEIREKLQENEPELALDRLHTFCVKVFRELCNKYKLEYKKDDGLHTLLKKYRDFLEKSKIIQSTMTIQILKLNTNVLNNFNTVRNNESFAHDNKILNKTESKLICNHVISLLKFIDEIDIEFENLVFEG